MQVAQGLFKIGMGLIFLVSPVILTAGMQSVMVPFYTENISIQYHDNIVFGAGISPSKYNQKTGKSQVEEFYKLLEKKTYGSGAPSTKLQHPPQNRNPCI